MKFQMLTVAAFWCGTMILNAAQLRPAPYVDRSVRLFDSRHDLHGRDGVGSMTRQAIHLIDTYEEFEKNLKAGRRDLLNGRPLEELGQSELELYFHPPGQELIKKDRRVLEALLVRLAKLDPGATDDSASVLRSEIAELCAAAENNHRNPIPRVNMLSSVWLAVDNLNNAIGGGEYPAANVDKCSGAECSCDPPASSFWRPPLGLERQNLAAGFGRLAIPPWHDRIWNYAAPKTSQGSNPGFEIVSGGLGAKLKFAETHSEPFIARIFHALGYNVDVTDHVSALRIRYNRRMLREMNLHQPLELKIGLVGNLSFYTVNLQPVHDPFSPYAGAVLNDGTFLSVDELKSRLLIDTDGEHPEMVPGNFDEAFEARIKWLVTGPANFQPDDPGSKSLGPWDFGQLDHPDLRELRGAGLLAAWLGWYDTRFDNTRLRLVRGELQHCLSDLGGGLGRSESAFDWRVESANDFPWTFTEPAVHRGKGRMTTPFRVVHYHTILDNEAFQEMTTADARWMARWIGRLSRDQIVAALEASGYDPAETMLYAEKLIYRRNRLMRDLGLSGEFPDLDRVFDSHYFDYRPAPGTASENDGEGRNEVVSGSLVWLDPDADRSVGKHPENPVVR